MSKVDTYEYDFLRLTFCGFGIAQMAGGGGTTTLWAGLHTVDPTDAGSTVNEGGYTAYTRVAVDRSTLGFAVTSGTGAAPATVSPVAPITFPQCITTSTGTFGWFTIYQTSVSPSSQAIYNGTVVPTMNFGQNVTPRLTTGSSITED